MFHSASDEEGVSSSVCVSRRRNIIDRLDYQWETTVFFVIQHTVDARTSVAESNELDDVGETFCFS